MIQTTVSLFIRWIELLDYERDGYEFQQPSQKGESR